MPIDGIAVSDFLGNYKWGLTIYRVCDFLLQLGIQTSMHLCSLFTHNIIPQAMWQKFSSNISRVWRHVYTTSVEANVISISKSAESIYVSQ